MKKMVICIAMAIAMFCAVIAAGCGMANAVHNSNVEVANSLRRDITIEKVVGYDEFLNTNCDVRPRVTVDGLVTMYSVYDADGELMGSVIFDTEV